MRRAVFALAALLAFASARAEIVDTPTEKQLFAPAAGWRLSLPQDDWSVDQEQRRDDSAVYYMLTSKSRDLIFSIYIDKSAACQSGPACLAAALKNPAFAAAQDLKKSEQGAFSVAQFFLDGPMGLPVKQAHVVAEAYIDGYWVDIHLSRLGKERPDIQPMLDLLKAVVIKPAAAQH